MKRILLIITVLIITLSPVFAEPDWFDLYEKSNCFPSRLMNDIDPWQDEDNNKYTYSPYPLFRTSSTLYYKKYSIPPGYYQLTPRNFGGKYYVFFKTNGKVKFIVPVVKKDLTPSAVYEKYIPKTKQTKSQKASKKWMNFWYKRFKNSGKQPPPHSYVEMLDTGEMFVLKLYFGESCYFTVYKKVPY